METAGTGVEDFVSRPVKSISAVDITGRLAVVVDVYGGDVQVLADVEPCYMYVPFEAIKWKAAHSLRNCVPLC